MNETSANEGRGSHGGDLRSELNGLRELSSTQEHTEASLAALSELGHKLAWLARVKYYHDYWTPPRGGLEAELGSALGDGDQDKARGESASSQAQRGREGTTIGPYSPRCPLEEALIATMVFLEEERKAVEPKGKSKSQRVRLALLPMLILCGRPRAACEFLSTAENASGCYEGGETFVRWMLLAHACLAARLPGRAVRVSKSLLDSHFDAFDNDMTREELERERTMYESAASTSFSSALDDDEHFQEFSTPTSNGTAAEEASEVGAADSLTSSLFATNSGAHKIHLLLLACRTKLDEHRMQMREHNFNGGAGAAVATGWAEKALNLCNSDPINLGHLQESCTIAYAGCILEALSRGHQGNPACSPPREVYDKALGDAETQLHKVVYTKSSRSLNPIAAYLLSLVYIRREKKKEAMDLLSGLQNTNSCVQVFMNTLLAVLYATEKRTTKGFNMLEKMLVELEMQGREGQSSLEKQYFVHRVQLRFAIFKRGATTIFQRGRHGDHAEVIQALARHGKTRLASLLAAELSIHFAFSQKFGKAKDLAEEAVTLDPSCPLAHHAMGVIHESTPEYDLALQKYEDAMAMCPQYGPSALASALIWEYQMDDYTWHARDLCEDALKWNLDDYEALLALGRMKEQMGDVEASQALNSRGLKHIGEMPCMPYYEFPTVIWEDDLSLDCYSF
ncbi:hypothetical protein A3770_12p66900 [Chloropicon primus]|uniref:Uncharacterized protein n=2 Tax=Chloropicon primus TaxID=1764295 RepID=A0A5B8MX60_9CHLO|nr:hypothetical protein A3770_12p66900 [Chloropicon primus]|eukprot:QDZ24172.1 hypothetical protein A3770_12p66900 [Chloropicon primus]